MPEIDIKSPSCAACSPAGFSGKPEQVLRLSEQSGSDQLFPGCQHRRRSSSSAQLSKLRWKLLELLQEGWGVQSHWISRTRTRQFRAAAAGWKLASWLFCFQALKIILQMISDFIPHCKTKLKQQLMVALQSLIMFKLMRKSYFFNWMHWSHFNHVLPEGNLNSVFFLFSFYFHFICQYPLKNKKQKNCSPKFSRDIKSNWICGSWLKFPTRWHPPPIHWPELQTSRI